MPATQSDPPIPERLGGRRFRKRLAAAMMLAISGVTVLGLYLAQTRMSASLAQEGESAFRAELKRLRTIQDLRHAALAERCRALVRRPRIQAVFEDDALDLLYLSASDELQDVVRVGGSTKNEEDTYTLRGTFYRFLDEKGAVIPPGNATEAGALTKAQEAQLGLPRPPSTLQLGYLVRGENNRTATADEIIALPIVAADTEEPLAALVVGFESSKPDDEPASAATRNGIWTGGALCMSGLAPALRDALVAELQHADALQKTGGLAREVQLAGAPYLLLSTPLNPRALYPPAYEVTLYSLADAVERQRTIRWEILAAGIFLLLGGFAVSAFFSARLSDPVEKLAVDSEENRAHWTRAEAALQLTNEELQRAARFSADASHQLKTPLTVLRAGLEELLADGQLAPEMREEISTLIHQTYRLAQVVEDLLLLSRMDAGRLQLALEPIDLHALIAAWLDDLSAIPDGKLLKIESDVPKPLLVRGEKRYTNLIIQNLLENARKYNRPGGRVSVTAQSNGETVILRIINTGQAIAASTREHIFERFHRGAAAENVPGHGLGLNLARELARLHGGDLWLASSDADCTEFCVRFLLTNPSVL